MQRLIYVAADSDCAACSPLAVVLEPERQWQAGTTRECPQAPPSPPHDQLLRSGGRSHPLERSCRAKGAKNLDAALAEPSRHDRAAVPGCSTSPLSPASRACSSAAELGSAMETECTRPFATGNDPSGWRPTTAGAYPASE